MLSILRMDNHNETKQSSGKLNWIDVEILTIGEAPVSLESIKSDTQVSPTTITSALTA